MNCADLTSQLGYLCAPIDGGGIAVTTPHLLPSGASIAVFIEPIPSGGVRLWDAGEILFEIVSSGVQIASRRTLRGLHERVGKAGAILTHDGYLEVLCMDSDLPRAFGRFIAAAFEISKWMEESLERAPDRDALVEEVAMLLREQSVNECIERDIKIRGFSEQVWTFDIRNRGRLIDCVAAHHAAGAAEVKKLVDIRASTPYRETDILVVVDDRADPVRAQQELKVISQLADAQPFSSFRSNLELPSQVH